MTNLTLTTPVHDKDMARDFLAGLDPRSHKFTFQFFSDGHRKHAEIFHGTLDEVWPKVQALNTPERGVGVFVTVNETDFKGRRTENIVRPRALFVDADGKEQAKSCTAAIQACGATPSMIVESGRGLHCYYVCPDIPRNQFSAFQKALIDKFGTDPAVTDLPRVMRLPGTLHLKNPVKPRLVKIHRANGAWQLSELIRTLNLSLRQPTTKQAHIEDLHSAVPVIPRRFAHRPIETSLGAGIETNIEDIRSAVSVIPPSAISTEQEWTKFARGLAHEAAVYPDQADQLWEILDTASRRASNYDEGENESRWSRYIDEAFARDCPITIASVFDLAKKHGWPPRIVASTNSSEDATIAWSAAELKVSFSNVPHRQWLYGTYLIRGEITVLAAPGGAGKTALATGMAVEIASGKKILGEKIWGNDDPNLKVLFINAEDSGVEIQRRVWAFCMAHNVAEQDLGRLFVAGTDDTRVQRLSFLQTTDKNQSVLDQPGFQVLETALQSLGPDVVILDPLVAFCSGGNMNDNAVMSLVMRELKRLAANFDCSVLIVHHTRKGGDVGNAEAISGAAATVNLSRRAIMPVPMTREDAEKLKVLPSQRHRYLKVLDAKSNLAPRSDDSPWYELHSVELPNPMPPIYPFGDNVQAIFRVTLPINNASITADDHKIRRAICDLVDRGKIIDGQSYPYSPAVTGAKNERTLLDDAVAAVANATAPQQWHSDDLQVIVKRTIETLKLEKWLVEGEKIKGPRFRRGNTLRVDWSRTPRSKERDADGQSTEASNDSAEE